MDALLRHQREVSDEAMRAKLSSSGWITSYYANFTGPDDACGNEGTFNDNRRLFTG